MVTELEHELLLEALQYYALNQDGHAAIMIAELCHRIMEGGAMLRPKKYERD
jgi:hypothetical protein